MGLLTRRYALILRFFWIYFRSSYTFLQPLVIPKTVEPKLGLMPQPETNQPETNYSGIRTRLNQLWPICWKTEQFCATATRLCN